jgi:hypothetical protein
MATSTELAKKKIITEDGVLTATVIDFLSPDRIALMLIRGSAAAVYARTADDTPLVSRTLKDLLIFPVTEE